MQPNEALQRDQLYLSFFVLQDPSFINVKKDLSQALKLNLNSIDEIYELAPSKFLTIRRRVNRAVRHHLIAALVKLQTAICIDFDYCKKRESPATELVELLAKIIAESIPTASIEASALTVLLELLDSLCGCRVAV